MNFVKAIAILISSILAFRVVDGFMVIAPLGQAGVDGVLIGVNQAARLNGLLNERLDCACWTFSSLRMTIWPPRCTMPKMGGFSAARVPRPRLPLSRRRRPLRPC